MSKRRRTVQNVLNTNNINPDDYNHLLIKEFLNGHIDLFFNNDDDSRGPYRDDIPNNITYEFYMNIYKKWEKNCDPDDFYDNWQYRDLFEVYLKWQDSENDRLYYIQKCRDLENLIERLDTQIENQNEVIIAQHKQLEMPTILL
tara:strand:+ start:86 stop:517 length:432 start_codon:yes stop_codon:yes gene_type:complete